MPLCPFFHPPGGKTQGLGGGGGGVCVGRCAISWNYNLGRIFYGKFPPLGKPIKERPLQSQFTSPNMAQCGILERQLEVGLGDRAQTQ